jgi:arylsulfatase A-like enzyme
MRDYVLAELKPDAVVNWLTEPDRLQHAIGAGSPQARGAIRNDDREIGLLLERLRELGLAEKTNVIVVSDHGFGHSAFGVDVTGELIKAGLKAGPDSDDVVVASSGQTILLYVRERNAERISAVVRFLHRQSWAGVVFTAAPSGSAPSGEGAPAKGREPGTFALELVHMANAARGPDIVFTFPWSSARGPFGLQGTDYTEARATGPLAGTAGNHGSMSPWVVRNTFLAWGPDFKRSVTVRTPASNVDLVPTLLALMNLDKNVP